MNIAIFASGGGSNADTIIQHFKHIKNISVRLVVTNNPKAGVLRVADFHQVPFEIITKSMLYDSSDVLSLMKQYEIDFIALAGFLWWVPDNILNEYQGSIVNIHPSLLPKYGGKGMYGHHIHEAVHRSKDTYTGLTIHHVTEEYDAGQIIVQVKCPVYASDTPQDIGRRVLAFEHAVYPRTIQFLIEDRNP